ncbi:DUF924 family protein [Phormidium nigroviride]|uniref:DUF924 family protein n=1 Tax=Phormidium nigroviride TaxID=482564 RepID=UPI004053F270
MIIISDERLGRSTPTACVPVEGAECGLEIIQRFGRFPHRNEILGRETTPEEAEFLRQPGSGF